VNRTIKNMVTPVSVLAFSLLNQPLSAEVTSHEKGRNSAQQGRDVSGAIAADPSDKANKAHQRNQTKSEPLVPRCTSAAETAGASSALGSPAMRKDASRSSPR